MTDDTGQDVAVSSNYSRRRGEWYYAALCVPCRVCDADVGELCKAKNGGDFFSAGWRHHYWRYRDVRHLIGRDLAEQRYVDPETWRLERQQRNELVNA